MSLLKDEGVVLSARSFGEADSCLTIFTRHSGKKSYIVKNIRKSKKRSLLIAQPGTITEFAAYCNQNKNCAYISDFSIISSAENICCDLKKIYYLHLIIELVLQTSPENEKLTFVYLCLIKTIEILKTENDEVFLSLFFLLQLIKNGGILPDLNNCGCCGTDILNTAFFSFTEYAFYCENCGNSKYLKFNVDSENMNYIREIVRSKYRDIYSKKKASAENLKILLGVLDYIERYYNISLKSKSCILQIC